MLTRRGFVTGAAAALTTGAAAQGVRPNILWITCEDTSPNRLGCYGGPNARTPNLDRLAARGVRYDRAFSTSGVCAPSRSTIITGMYATTLGSHHMRSTIALPPDVKCFPEYLREAGYYCTNNVKTDYNFATPAAAWDETSETAHWRRRPPGRPFFSVFNFTHTHEFQPRLAPAAYAARTGRLRSEDRQSPDAQRIPPYYPHTRAVREEWARTLELTTAVDYEAGILLAQLQEDGLAGNTIVFFWGDHGSGLPRGKRWLYDSGCRVPLIVSIPEQLRLPGQGKSGTVGRELVSLIDLAPTVLNLAGLPLAAQFQGRAFLGPSLAPPRTCVFGTHDRQDERYEMIRMVRDARFKYLRNYMPGKPYYQHMNSAEGSAIMQELRRVHGEGNLPPAAARFMAARKPPEELYDTPADPYELSNLADSEAFRPTLERMRREHLRWEEETRDLGWIPEPELYARERELGSRRRILEGAEGAGLLRRLHEVYRAGETGGQDLLLRVAAGKDAAVRYWALLSLRSPKVVEAGLNDGSPAARIAAAHAGLRCGLAERSAGLLAQELNSNDEWVRLLAANVLDEAGEFARPHVPALKRALTDPRNTTTYVPRVVNHTLNVLLETSNKVR
jgi:uncharacterized sulfatase